MPNFNLLVNLSSYSDNISSNSPQLSNFKWTRNLTGLTASNPVSVAALLAPGETRSFFNGTRTLTQDGTTNYSFAPKFGTPSTYVLSAVAGTLPNFRAPRALAVDATSAFTVTLNGPLAIITNSGGTSPNLTSVVVGDIVSIPAPFNLANIGQFVILAKSANSITLENRSAAAEGPLVLGSGFASFQIYSAAGVQAGDILSITSGFSPVSQASFKVTKVYANSLEFFASESHPTETVLTNVLIYSSAKQFVYIEADQNSALTINGVSAGSIEPFNTNGIINPGVFIRKSTMSSLSVTNSSLVPANIFLAMIE